MFIKNIQKFFLLITFSAAALLVYLWYEDYNFNNTQLDKKYQLQIYNKHQKLKLLAYKHFKIKRTFPIIISNNMKSNRFGMATIDKSGKIQIHLNKKRFQENAKYMINDVFPHEYAHAIMFMLNDFSKENSGHTKRWQNICKRLNGLRCDRFVNHQDILIEKTNPFN